MSTSGSPGLVSPTVAPYSPSADHFSDDLKSAKITPWLRPRLGSSLVFEADAIFECLQRERQAERDALATVRRFNAILSARKQAWFWPKIAAALTAKHCLR